MTGICIFLYLDLDKGVSYGDPQVAQGSSIGDPFEGAGAFTPGPPYIMYAHAHGVLK